MRLVTRLSGAGVAGVLTAALTASVIPGAPAHGIAGGAPATEGAYPFVAKIEVGEARSCTGVLVEGRWVLTAASCFADAPDQAVPAGPPKLPTTATIGRTNLAKTTGQVRGVISLIPHADRKLVLAKLATRITDIAPIPLGTSAPATGDVLRVAGYGRTKTEWVPDLLHTALFRVRSVGDQTLDVLGHDPADASTCKGDGGGPAFREANGRAELVALNNTSWQKGCLDSAATLEGGTVTRVDDLAGWVAAATRVPDIPAPGDYSKDGMNDYVVFRPLTGEWRLKLRPSNGTAIHKWGAEDDIPVPGDYNNDGTHDYALYRPSTGEWRLKLRGSNGEAIHKWGAADDIPVPGDYNNDGTYDYVVFRPSTNEWRIKLRGSNAEEIHKGA
jgi:uncharacterized protein YegP (UPF0339 family)